MANIFTLRQRRSEEERADAELEERLYPVIWVDTPADTEKRED